MTLARQLPRLAIATAMAIAASCAVEGFDLDGVEPQAAAGGQGGQGGGTAIGGGAPGCQHFTWPSPPDSSDPGSDLADIVVAMRDLDIGETEVDSGVTVGFDLDNRCTCQGENTSCKEPTWATADHCDAPAGRDNEAAALWKSAIVFNPQLSSAEMSIDIDQGEFSILFRIRGYNGQPNDGDVELALYSSPGLAVDPCLPPNSLAKWDGSDRWPVLASSLVAPVGTGGGGGAAGAGGAGGAGGGCDAGDGGYDVNQPKFVDANAYVSGGTLVAALPQADFVFANKAQLLPVELAAGFLAGELVKQADGGWTLEDAVFTGRWRIDSLLRTILDVANSKDVVCEGDTLYSLIKTAICPHADIASTLGGPTTPCDSVSFAMRLRAQPALLGRVHVAPLFAASCPAGKGPVDSTCEP